jgi:endogenous inhibitor of DNA gyrase (YacG/DUF329 family)
MLVRLFGPWQLRRRHFHARRRLRERAKTESVKLRCPMCSKVIFVEEDHPARPFCSARCKLADLHNWLHGVYRIQGEPVSESTMNDDS